MPSYRVPDPADYGEGEDYLFCTLCFDLWSPYHVCWQVQRRWAITLAYTIIKELDNATQS